jgi:hypothetical protein
VSVFSLVFLYILPLIFHLNRQMWTALPCEKLFDVEETCRKYDVIGIDEGQFVCASIVLLLLHPPHSPHVTTTSPPYRH